MGKTAEHYVGEVVSLCFDGFCQFRVFVAVDHTPPGGNGINQFLVFGVEIDTFGVNDFIRLFHSFHLFIRIPDHNVLPFCFIHKVKSVC